MTAEKLLIISNSSGFPQFHSVGATKFLLRSVRFELADALHYEGKRAFVCKNLAFYRRISGFFR